MATTAYALTSTALYQRDEDVFIGAVDGEPPPSSYTQIDRRDDEPLVNTVRIPPEENEWLVAWAFETSDNEEVTVRIADPERAARDLSTFDDEPTLHGTVFHSPSLDAEIEAIVEDIGPVSLRPEEMQRLRDVTAPDARCSKEASVTCDEVVTTSEFVCLLSGQSAWGGLTLIPTICANSCS